MKNTTIGTCHFLSKAHADNYYKPYGYSSSDVSRKINEGEIFTGKPSLKKDERLMVDNKEGRYYIRIP